MVHAQQKWDLGSLLTKYEAEVTVFGKPLSQEGSSNMEEDFLSNQGRSLGKNRHLVWKEQGILDGWLHKSTLSINGVTDIVLASRSLV